MAPLWYFGDHLQTMGGISSERKVGLLREIKGMGTTCPSHCLVRRRWTFSAEAGKNQKCQFSSKQAQFLLECDQEDPFARGSAPLPSPVVGGRVRS